MNDGPLGSCYERDAKVQKSAQRTPTTNNWLNVWAAAEKADIIVYADGKLEGYVIYQHRNSLDVIGIDNNAESEG